MKKLVILALLFAFATTAQASTVAINEIEVEGCGTQEVVISGLSVYTEENIEEGIEGDTTTQIKVDGIVVQNSTDTAWAVVYEATAGVHNVVATVGSESDTSSFKVPGCSNGDPMNNACFAEDGLGSCYEKIKLGIVQWFTRGHEYCSVVDANGCVVLTKNLWMLE